jgi:hypothetical protein
MDVAIHLPDDIAQQVQARGEDIYRRVLESLALAWYQSGELSEEQLRRFLGYRTRLRVHAFLQEHGVPLRYTLADLEQDRAAHDRGIGVTLDGLVLDLADLEQDRAAHDRLGH